MSDQMEFRRIDTKEEARQVHRAAVREIDGPHGLLTFGVILIGGL